MLRLARHVSAVLLLALLGFAAPASATTFTVDSLADGADADVLLAPSCATAQNECTLRAAIQQANFSPGADEIVFSVTGTHVLTPTLGQLAVTSDITITGNGPDPAGTVIDADFKSRVIDVTAPALTPVTLSLSNLRIRNGRVINQDGAGIRGGASTIALDVVVVAGNAVDGASGEGGGVSSAGGTLQIASSTITDNYSKGHGGGVVLTGAGGGATIRNSTISGNGATTGGGGLYTAAPVSLVGTTIAANGSSGGSSQFGIEPGTSSATIENTIVSGAASACGLPSGFSPAANHSIDSGATCGFGSAPADGNKQDTDPKLGPLVTEVGSSNRVPVHKPLLGSPTIDAASEDCGGLTHDERGIVRPLGRACDIGSVERRPDAPGDDAATVAEDSGTTEIQVLANDAAADGDLAVQSVAQPAHGVAAVAAGGTRASYAPAANYCGADSFDYTTAGGATATVTVTVTCADDAPSAVDDAATLAEDAGETPIDVLANDDDPDGGPKRVESVTGAGHGVVLVIDDGARVAYRPDADYCGPDALTYTLNGGSSATIAITVDCVDDPVVQPPPPPPPTGRCGGLTATIVLGKGTIAIVGSRQRDVIVGTTGSEKIDGGAGNDVVCAGKGNDTLLGRAGKDRLFGGRGNDLIDGGAGLDTIAAGAGRDRVAGGRDRVRDRVDCGAATDRARYFKGDRLRRCERVTGKRKKRRRADVPFAR